MSRYVLEVMYDGTKFHGSQIQGNLVTVQLSINEALQKILKSKIETTGASRTDEGVHALCNFFHFDYEGNIQKDFLYKMNAVTPYGLAVKNLFKAASSTFNARFAALSRRYRYTIYSSKNPFLMERAFYFPFKINEDILAQTASIIKMSNHFESFSKRNTQSKTFICNINESYWERVGDELCYIVEGNRFLRGMVRGLVATQLQVARGKLTVNDFNEIFELNDCTKAFFNVEGYGLYLEKIEYPFGTFLEPEF